jgi:hypothetical protein
MRMKNDGFNMSRIEEQVIQRIRSRAEAGLAKYGTTMERKDLTAEQWAIHLQEELLDAAVYLERLIEELKNKPTT